MAIIPCSLLIPEKTRFFRVYSPSTEPDLFAGDMSSSRADTPQVSPYLPLVSSIYLPPQLSPYQPPAPSPFVPPADHGEDSKTTFGVIIGAVIGSLLTLVFCAIFFVWMKRRLMSLENRSPRTRPPKVALPPSSLALGVSTGTFTYEELAEATNGFSESNFLGQGGFGFVHKGVLPDKQTVAIKQLKSESRQGEREFQTEVEVITRIHHRHLVSLVGYCIAEAQRTMMLVYEFVPNKTLEFHLHEKGTTTIDWTTRMKIAIGSAKGLTYLHEDCKPKIIHRDIKAANILLDSNFEPKISDFGLAKLLLDTDTHVSTARIKGTFGYLSPEYANFGRVTEKIDVFSFGVVLLELITGRKPVSKTGSFPYDSLVEWARPLLNAALENGMFEDIADPRLHNSYNSEEMFRMVSCAVNCVRHSAERRPPMSQVVQALLGNIFLDNWKEESTQVDEELIKQWNVVVEGEDLI